MIVVLGHSGCGAVTAAVDAYLQPLKFWSKSTSPMLRAILQRIFVAVREAANGLKEVWGDDARDHARLPRGPDRDRRLPQRGAGGVRPPAWRSRRPGKWEIEVLYGVYNLNNHQVCMPVDPGAPASDENVHLAYAPTNPRDFRTLAVQMAEILRQRPVADPATAQAPAEAASKNGPGAA